MRFLSNVLNVELKNLYFGVDNTISASNLNELQSYETNTMDNFEIFQPTKKNIHHYFQKVTFLSFLFQIDKNKVYDI